MGTEANGSRCVLPKGRCRPAGADRSHTGLQSPDVLTQATGVFSFNVVSPQLNSKNFKKLQAKGNGPVSYTCSAIYQFASSALSSDLPASACPVC